MSSPPELYTMPPLSPTLHSHSPVHTYAYPSPPPPPSSSNVSLHASSSGSNRTVKIPRPPNAFLIFRSHFLKTNQIPREEECHQQTISRVAGECWNMLSADEKAVWKHKAEEAERAHMTRHPGYKFSPARRTKVSKKTKKSKPCDEATAQEKQERTRKLREEFTPFKGEAVPSQRKTKQLERSIRGTRRATRSKKAPASISTSASNPAASTDPTSSSVSSSSPSSSSTTTTSVLFAPLPLHAPHGAFVPSSTRLTPAPSAGPQITRITQSPPLTPFHPSDRQPQLQLQLPEFTLRDSSTAQWGFQQERELGVASGMEEISLSHGNVYPAMGGSNASAYFEPRGPGMNAPMPVSDVDHSRARSHSLDIGMGNMGMGMDSYLDLHGDYPAFSMDDTFMGSYRDAPETPYDLSDAFCFSPAASSSSPAWSCQPLTPSSYSSSQPQTPLTITLAAPYHHHHHELNLNNEEFPTSWPAEYCQAYEPKFQQESFTATAASHTGNGAQDYGAWGQELGVGGLEIELGTMLHF